MAHLIYAQIFYFCISDHLAYFLVWPKSLIYTIKNSKREQNVQKFGITWATWRKTTKTFFQEKFLEILRASQTDKILSRKRLELE